MTYQEVYKHYQAADENEVRTAAACCISDHYFNEDFTIESAPLEMLRDMVIDAVFELYESFPNFRDGKAKNQ